MAKGPRNYLDLTPTQARTMLSVRAGIQPPYNISAHAVPEYTKKLLKIMVRQLGYRKPAKHNGPAFWWLYRELTEIANSEIRRNPNARGKIWTVAMQRMLQILGHRRGKIAAKVATRIASRLPPMIRASGVVNPIKKTKRKIAGKSARAEAKSKRDVRTHRRARSLGVFHKSEKKKLYPKRTMRHRMKEVSGEKNPTRRKAKWCVFALKRGKRFYATGTDIRQPFDTEKAKAKTYSTQAAALKIARAMAKKTPHAVQLGVCN